jgi:hypothetical protein
MRSVKGLRPFERILVSKNVPSTRPLNQARHYIRNEQTQFSCPSVTTTRGSATLRRYATLANLFATRRARPRPSHISCREDRFGVGDAADEGSEGRKASPARCSTPRRPIPGNRQHSERPTQSRTIWPAGICSPGPGPSLRLTTRCFAGIAYV